VSARNAGLGGSIGADHDLFSRRAVAEALSRS
jgi:hypothetical protein